MKNNSPEKFTLWKRPWHKRIVLAATIMQFISLWMNISEYQKISRVKDLIFSAAEFEEWSVAQIFQCSLTGLTALAFLGTFLIRNFSRSIRSARLAESVFLLVLGIGWIITGYILGQPLSTVQKIFNLIVLLPLFVGGMYGIWKYGKNSSER